MLGRGQDRVGEICALVLTFGVAVLTRYIGNACGHTIIHKGNEVLIEKVSTASRGGVKFVYIKC